MRRFAIPCVAAAALSLCVFASAAVAKPVLGIADNKASSFADPRLLDLHLGYARFNVPWDVLSDSATLPNVDAWMAAVKTAGMQPLVSFDRSRRPGMQGVNPTPAQLADALTKWRARWPGQISDVSAWNEPNIANKKPATVAAWWLALRRACPSCNVMPGELVDRNDLVGWAKAFVAKAKRSPAIWPLHAYVDANNFSTANTARFLNAVKGKVWFTETGGVVSRSHGVAKFAGKGVDFQRQATQFLLTKLAALSPRIERIYLYSWATGASDRNWDSGLVAPDGSARPALNVVRSYLGLPAADVAPAGDTFKQKKPKKPKKSKG